MMLLFSVYIKSFTIKNEYTQSITHGYNLIREYRYFLILA